MSKSSIILELGPGRLRACEVRAGQITRDATVRFDAPGWDESFRAELNALDQPLTTALAAIGWTRGAKPTHVGLAYHAPTTTCEVFSCPGAGSSGDEAAMLALCDSFGQDAGAHPYGMLGIARDAAGDARQTHRLITAETDETAERLNAWLSRAGLHAEWIAPMPAFHLCELVRSTMENAADRGAVILRVGEHRAHLAAAVAGRLRLVRHVSLDLATLTEALTLPLTVRDTSGTREVRWDADKARSVLLTHGIPERGSVVDPATGVNGAAMLPGLQPVLQRALVEMRQALRFGLEEPERAATRFMIYGPGAAVPHLGEVLAGQLGLAFALPERRGESEGDLERAASFKTPVVNLLPRRAAAAVGSRRVRIAMVAGAAIALGWAGVEGVMAYSQMREIESQRASLAATAAAAEEFIAQSEAIRIERQRLDRLNDAVREVVGDSPDWSAWLNELATVLPPSATLTDIACSQDSNEPRCDLRGTIRLEPGAIDLTGLVQRFEASPLVAGVSLGGVQRSSAVPGASEFQATVRLVPLPVTASTRVAGVKEVTP